MSNSDIASQTSWSPVWPRCRKYEVLEVNCAYTLVFENRINKNRLWDPPNLLSNGYRVSFPEGKEAGA
jgi:hypothetical protein